MTLPLWPLAPEKPKSQNYLGMSAVCLAPPVGFWPGYWNPLEALYADVR